MIGKFVFFGILISAPLAITGLKCYQALDLAGNTALITCPPPTDFGCSKAEIGGSIVKTCAPKSIYDEIGKLGCTSASGATVCFCQTDG